MFPETINHKITGANSTFLMKERTVGKDECLFFKIFLLVLTKLSFWEGDWALGYHSLKLRQFPDISKFPMILSVNSFSNL